MGMKSFTCRLISTGNNGYRYRYEFSKAEVFKDLFKELLLELSFDRMYVDNFFMTYEDDKPVSLEIQSVKDSVMNCSNENFDMDIFFGAENIILIVRTHKVRKLIKTIEKLFRFSGK